MEKLKEKIKILTQKKYFTLIVFSLLLVLFSTLLVTTVRQDAEAAAPQDNMLRTTGTVNYVNTYTIEAEDGTQSLHYDIGLHVETEDGKVYDDVFLYDVPSVDVGSTIKLKYDKNTTGIFLIANEEPPHFRVILYVLYSALILFSIGGIVVSIRILQKNKQQKIIAQNLENMQQPAQTDSHGIDYNSTQAYQGYDGTETDLNPFAGSDMDYNSIYEYDQNMKDAEYSATETYTGYSEPSNNPMDAPYSPTDTYTGYSEPLNDATNEPDAIKNTTDTKNVPAPETTEDPSAAAAAPVNNPVPGYPPMNAPYPPGMYMGYPPMNTPYPPNMYMGYGGPGYPPMNTPFPPAMYMGYPPMNAPYSPIPPVPDTNQTETSQQDTSTEE